MALSRARLGLYILGRRDVFEACYELRPAFELLLQRPDKLVLSTGEMWPSTRIQTTELDAAAPAAEAAAPGSGQQEATMEGVEHLGQFVFEMTGVRARQLRAERGLPEGQGQGQDLERGGNLAPVTEEGSEDIIAPDQDQDPDEEGPGFVVPDDEDEDVDEEAADGDNDDGNDNNADDDDVDGNLDEDGDVDVDAEVGEEEERERTVGEGFEAEED